MGASQPTVLFLKEYGDRIGILGDLFKKYGHQKVTYEKTKLGAMQTQFIIW